MVKPASPFPLTGVVGIVTENSRQLTTALAAGLGAVEIRADWLLAGGHPPAAIMGLVAEATKRGLAVVFTVRHAAAGGKFDGDDNQRVELGLQAVQAGAKVVDAEWRSLAADRLLDLNLPVLLSYHNFQAMPTATQWEDIHREAVERCALGIKIVPTAKTIPEVARVLRWVEARKPDEPHRIGFAMGAAGRFSRILCIAFGSPITYASLDDQPVAPGQIVLHELKHTYAIDRLRPTTRVYGIAGINANASLSPLMHNRGFVKAGLDAVYVPFQTHSLPDLIKELDSLRIDGLSITIPFKEEALRISDHCDDRSRACGAANTLCIDRRSNPPLIKASNTDVDGVLVPIAKRRPLAGLRVAVIGNGGAARGAIQALTEAGAIAALFYRNPARGLPVAQALNVAGYPISAIDDRFEVYINATPLGSNPDDPAPAPAAIFSRPEQIAFDMTYANPNPRFLVNARAAGVHCIDGRQMLVAQGMVQFEHFTGIKPDPETFKSD